MKSFLLPILAALALPTTVNAESHWLILTYGLGYHNGGKALEKIEMPNGEIFEREGRKWEQSLTQSASGKHKQFQCFVGK